MAQKPNTESLAGPIEYDEEKSTTDPSPNKTCDNCGKEFYAYEIPGRTEYICNDCK